MEPVIGCQPGGLDELLRRREDFGVGGGVRAGPTHLVLACWGCLGRCWDARRPAQAQAWAVGRECARERSSRGAGPGRSGGCRQFGEPEVPYSDRRSAHAGLEGVQDWASSAASAPATASSRWPARCTCCGTRLRRLRPHLAAGPGHRNRPGAVRATKGLIIVRSTQPEAATRALTRPQERERPRSREAVECDSGTGTSVRRNGFSDDPAVAVTAHGDFEPGVVARGRATGRTQAQVVADGVTDPVGPVPAGVEPPELVVAGRVAVELAYLRSHRLRRVVGQVQAEPVLAVADQEEGAFCGPPSLSTMSRFHSWLSAVVPLHGY